MEEIWRIKLWSQTSPAGVEFDRGEKKSDVWNEAEVFRAELLYREHVGTLSLMAQPITEHRLGNV